MISEDFVKFKVGQLSISQVEKIISAKLPPGFKQKIKSGDWDGMWVSYYRPQNRCAFEIMSSREGEKCTAIDLMKYML